MAKNKGRHRRETLTEALIRKARTAITGLLRDRQASA